MGKKSGPLYRRGVPHKGCAAVNGLHGQLRYGGILRSRTQACVCNVGNGIDPKTYAVAWDLFLDALFLCGNKKGQKEATGGAPLQESPVPTVIT